MSEVDAFSERLLLLGKDAAQLCLTSRVLGNQFDFLIFPSRCPQECISLLSNQRMETLPERRLQFGCQNVIVDYWNVKSMKAELAPRT